MKREKHPCPFCLEKFTRTFLLNQHIPQCQIREDYFNKKLNHEQMEIIKRRVDGEHYRIEVIETENYKGKVIGEDV
jgi:hypothetical protein